MVNTPLKQPDFLPMTRREMDRLGWDELDILLVSGDAYMDHPSFGTAMIGRWLVANGFRTGIVAQPRWDTGDDITVMGRPRLFAGVSAGSLDSMLAHYTAFRKKRSDDAYTPGGKAGARPNRACIAYTNAVQRAYPGLPVTLGGIEASLRRIAHYDFWADKVRNSVLLDAKATAITYGMAENSILRVAELLQESSDVDIKTLRPLLATIPGLAVAGTMKDVPDDHEVMELPSFEDIKSDPKQLVKATIMLEQHVHQNRVVAVQPVGNRAVIITPPGPLADRDALDAMYDLPYSREAHPSYTERIPAMDMIRTSVTTHRGCSGGCSFCTLALHQGRHVRSRSRDSILGEVQRITKGKKWSGSLSDVGGPSANMWQAKCGADQSKCKRSSCLTPSICNQYRSSQSDFVKLLRDVKSMDTVKHVRVASGWRMDLGLTESRALRTMVREFVGGQCKVAPEHLTDTVLSLMRKPGLAVFEQFLSLFAEESRKAGKEQYVIPYLMSAFPGCTDKDMKQLSGWLKNRGWRPEQVQCFIPLPGTAAAAMFHAGTDMKGNPIHVAKSDAERLRQHRILMPDVGKKPGSDRKKSKRKSSPKPVRRKGT